MNRVPCSVLAACLLVAVAPACQTADEAGGVTPIEGLANPSLHILFDNTRALPETGTFGWGISLLHIDPALKLNLSEIEARLHRSLRDALPSEGFTYTNEAPDYLVGFAVMAGASLDEAELNQFYGASLSFPARVDATPPMNYQAGVLILDLVERINGHLLWRGAIKADINLDLPEAKKQARCDGAIRELLRHYPNPHTAGRNAHP